MLAVVFEAPEKLSVKEIARPQPRVDEVLLKVRRAGICGTDIHIFQNEYMSQFPLVPGHEFVGDVVEAGGEAKGLAEGQRVAVDPNIYCNHCAFCRNKQFNHCLNWQGVGITRQGAFAEYVAVPASACYVVPETLSDADAAMIEPVSCVVHAMNRLEVKPGDSALVLGAGPMGLLLLQALRHRGAGEVAVLDRDAERLKLSRQLGATHVITAGSHHGAALSELAPHGYDIVVDATGAPQVIEEALSFLRPCGRYLQFGVAPRNARISIRPYDLFRYDWTLLGSFALSYTFEQAIAWMGSGVLQTQMLVSHRVPLKDFGEVFQAFREGRTLRAQVDPSGDGA